MSKATLARGALGAFTDLFEPTVKAAGDSPSRIQPSFMWPSQTNPSSYFSPTVRLFDTPPSITRTGDGYADHLEAKLRKGELTKNESSFLNIIPMLRELGPTPVSNDQVKQLAELRSVNLVEKLHGDTTAIRAINEQMDDLKYELDRLLDLEITHGTHAGEAPKLLKKEWQNLQAKKAELINREIGAGTYNSAEDIDTFYVRPIDSFWLPGGTGHRELRINSPHFSYSDVEPTETAAAPFIDDFNRLNKEIGELESPATAEHRELSRPMLHLLRNQREFLHNRMVDATVAENPDRYGHKIWKDNHWPDDENVLAHVRFSDRVGPDGDKILVIEEIQSTLHQKAIGSHLGETPVGYAKQISPPDVKPLTLDEFKDLEGIRAKLKADKNLALDPRIPENVRFSELEQRHLQWERYHREMGELDRPIGHVEGEAVPDLPYRKDWHELVLRRAMQLAAREGYDRVAFVPFGEQMERSNISQLAREILYHDGKLMAFDQVGQQLLGKPTDEFVRVGKKEVKNWIGEDAAKKLFDVDNSNYFPIIPWQTKSVGELGELLPTPDSSVDFGIFSEMRDGEEAFEVGGKFFRDIYTSKLPRYLKKISRSDIEIIPTSGKIPSPREVPSALWETGNVPGEQYFNLAEDIIELPTVKVNAEVIKKFTGEGIKNMSVLPVAALPAAGLIDGEVDF